MDNQLLLSFMTPLYIENTVQYSHVLKSNKSINYKNATLLIFIVCCMNKDCQIVKD